MIACISPGSSSADHSLNTLRYIFIKEEYNELIRYADRLKEKSNAPIKPMKYDPANYRDEEVHEEEKVEPERLPQKPISQDPSRGQNGDASERGNLQKVKPPVPQNKS